MKTFPSVLLASTALAIGLGLPAWAVVRGGDSPCVAVCSLGVGEAGQGLVLVDGDEEDDDGGWFAFGEDEDEDCADDDDDDDEDHDDEDEEDCPGVQALPAPSGPVAPPANGLFGNGAPPIAVTK